MAITEIYMGPGDFRVSMSIATPHLMETVTRGGYLVVTPQHLGDPRGYTNDGLLAAARYTGVVLETIWTDGVLTLEGAGLEWWMGDLDGVGWPCPTRNYSGAAMSTVIDEISTGGIIPDAVYTIGSTITGGTYTGAHSAAETVKEVLMQVMKSENSHYRISPNGEINVEDVGDDNIYQDTPTVVFVRSNWGADGLWTGAPVDQLKSSYSIREWLDASNVEMYGLQDALCERVDTRTTLATQETFEAELQMQEIRTSYAQLGDLVGVGDVVYIHDPGSGFTGTDEIWFRGQALNPAKFRIHEFSWPVIEGMGVYYRPGDSSTVSSDQWVDLTHTVAVEPVRRASTYLRALEAKIEEGGGT